MLNQSISILQVLSNIFQNMITSTSDDRMKKTKKINPCLGNNLDNLLKINFFAIMQNSSNSIIHTLKYLIDVYGI